MLDVVVARRVGLPDVDLDPFEGIAGPVLDGADAQQGEPLWVVRHLGAGFEDGGVVRVEGPQHGAFGRVRGFGVVDVVDEEGETEDVGEEDELLSSDVLVSAYT